MEYFIYSKIRDTAIREGIAGALRGIAGSVFPAGDLIFIDAVNGRKLQLIVTCLQDYLQPVQLDKEDIIYVFYPHDHQEIRMYMLKRKGRIRIRRWTMNVL
jgi:hypothetical protein